MRYFINAPAERNGRQVAEDVKLSPWACHKALNELFEQGVLILRKTGKTHLYKLNSENYLVREMLSPLFNKERKLVKTIAKDLIKGLPAKTVSVILFGSVARKEERPSSDIDVAVIVSDTASKKKISSFLKRRSFEVLSKYGNIPSAYIITRKDFINKHRKGLDLIKNIISEGEVIFGKPVREIL